MRNYAEHRNEKGMNNMSEKYYSETGREESYWGGILSILFILAILFGGVSILVIIFGKMFFGG